ncbi:MAG: transcription initiation factor IIB family protein [Desulfurococcaceae archaeon]
MSSSAEAMRCSNCGYCDVVYDDKLLAYVCIRCGTVLDDHPIYQGTEGFIKNGEAPRYSGAFTNRVHDHGVGSTEISGSIKTHLKHGRSWAIRHMDIRIEKEDRKVAKALRELNELTKRLNPPIAVKETAGAIIQKVIKNANFKENTIKKIIIAALYLAYKKNGQPRPVKVFVNETGITEKDLWEGIKKIRELCEESRLTPSSYDPRYYVNFISWKLNLPPEVQSIANTLIISSENSVHTTGKSPASLAAAAVYLASILTNNRRRQLDVGEAVGLSDVAIRNAYNALIQAVVVDVLM